MDERVERMVKHFAVEVDATPEQKEKLTTIAKGAARDLVPTAGKIKQARQNHPVINPHRGPPMPSSSPQSPEN